MGLITYVVAPVQNSYPSKVLFQTWTTDCRIYTAVPNWPSISTPIKFDRRPVDNLGNSHQSIISAPCNPPPNAAVERFPTTGTPTPCIAEIVSCNRPEYDYIVSNGLNTQQGLSNASTRDFHVEFPQTSIAVKTDLVPAATAIQWIPDLIDVTGVRSYYYTAFSDGVEYALVSLHIASNQNPDWAWGSWEHQFNPSRCDTMGSYDSFGAQVPVVLPNKNIQNTQYGTCPKTQQLSIMMLKAGIASVWQNYCL